MPLVRGADGVLELPVGHDRRAPGPPWATASRSASARRPRRGSISRDKPAAMSAVSRRMHRPPMAATAPARVGRLLDLALPPACAGCGARGRARSARACLPGAARAARRCRPGRRSGSRRDRPTRCSSSSGARRSRAPTRRALHALKYAGERRLAAPARRGGRGALATGRARAATCSCPVPVHAERGAGSAATTRRRSSPRSAAARLRAPVARRLVRTRATTAQFRPGPAASGGQRRGRVRGGPRGARRHVAGRWVVLVDDVVTTGATLCALGAGAAATRAPRR